MSSDDRTPATPGGPAFLRDPQRRMLLIGVAAALAIGVLLALLLRPNLDEGARREAAAPDPAAVADAYKRRIRQLRAMR